MKKAIINSLHSDSIRYIRKAFPETVISFDAHPDLGHWKNIGVVKSILQLKISEKVKTGLFRGSVQALLRATLPRARIYSVVPEACVITDFNWDLLQNSLMGGNAERKRFTKHLAISTWKEKLATLKIEGCTIPPNNIESLLPKAKGNSLVFDIDVDYIFELTDECHTPAGFMDTPVPTYGMPKDNLGSITNVLGIINAAKPDLVTLSEITNKCLKSKNKNWSQLKGQLKRLGYDVKDGIVYSDSEVKQVLGINGDFFNFYSKRNNLEGPEDFLRAYKEFFDGLGETKEDNAEDSSGNSLPFI